MNPGTTLFIIIGIIGLLLYILKAIRINTFENFSSNVNQTDILQPKLSKIFSAIETPDLGNGDYIKKYNPSPIFAKPTIPTTINTTQLQTIPDIKNSPQPSDSLTLSASSPQTLPPVINPNNFKQTQTVLLPPNNLERASSILNERNTIIPAVSSNDSTGNSLSGKPYTISDMQGSMLEKTDSMNEPKITKKKKKSKKSKKCPPMPDMSLYIRKDQIPCWGCVVP